MTRILLAVAAASAALAAPAAASAESYSVAIGYADLNLASAAGRSALDGRIRAAASRLCGTTGYVALRTQRSAASCADTLSARAREQVGVQIAAKAPARVTLAAD